MRKIFLFAGLPIIGAGISPSGQDDPYRAAQEFYMSSLPGSDPEIRGQQEKYHNQEGGI